MSNPCKAFKEETAPETLREVIESLDVPVKSNDCVIEATMLLKEFRAVRPLLSLVIHTGEDIQTAVQRVKEKFAPWV